MTVQPASRRPAPHRASPARAHLRRAVVALAVLGLSGGVLAAPATADDPVPQPTSVALSAPTPRPAVGTSFSVTATVTGAVDGTVQFALDGTDQGDAVPLFDGAATSPALSASAGVHTVQASFVAADPTSFAGSSASRDVTVDGVPTTTTVTVQPATVTATVAPANGDAAVPTGSVTFAVDGEAEGDADLIDGTATFDFTVPTGASHTVLAFYNNDDHFAQSIGSVVRADPAITATPSSARGRSRYGWYREPVTIAFACAPRGAVLVSACPAPVTVSGSGANQHVTRSVSAADGGTGTATASVNIDRVAPTAAITGAVNGARYFGALPAVRCAARDALSGPAACTVRTATLKGGTQARWTATATDRAGNARTVVGAATISTLAIAGLDYSGGYYRLHIWNTYTLLAKGATRPAYLRAVPYPARPTVTGGAFARSGSVGGSPRWTYALPITKAWLAHPYWTLAVRIGTTVQTLKVRVVR